MLRGGAFHWEGTIYLKARWQYRFVLQSLGPGTARNDSLADRRERDGVYGGMSPEWQVLMDGTSDRKQLMENTVTHRKPVQLSERRGDVITFSTPHHDPSSCVLDCLQSFDLHLWQST